MAANTTCIRFVFVVLVAAAVSIIVIISQGFVDKPLYAITNIQIIFQESFGLPKNQTTACSSHESLQKILLVISYPGASLKNIADLENLYSNRFPNIVFCVSKPIESSSKHKIIVLNLLHGITSYSCVAGAIRSYPSYQGYLFIKNDVVLNFWRISELNLSRIWQTPTLGSQTMFEQSHDPWIWWYTPWGLKACEKAYKRTLFLNSLNKQMTKNVKDMDSMSTWEIENSLNALLWNGRGRYNCYRGDSNIFFIPSKYGKVYEKMSQIFSDFQVHIDIAVSTIIAMLDLKEKNILLDGEDLGSIYGEQRVAWDTRLLLQHFNSSFTYIRPLSLSQIKHHKNVVEDLMYKMNRNETCAQLSK